MPWDHGGACGCLPSVRKNDNEKGTQALVAQ